MSSYTHSFDHDLQNVDGLSWLPWVGKDYAHSNNDLKLMIIGESHYYRGDTEEERQVDRKGYDDILTTRQMVEGRGWGTKTWKALPKLLFNTADYDDTRFWEDSVYYNFVQRPLSNHENERPSPRDYKKGWPVFEGIINILKPRYCLFIGVEASNYFSLGDIERSPKVAGVYPRIAKVNLDINASLIFVHHLGRCRKVDAWNNYLNDDHLDFVATLNHKAYTKPRG